MARYKHKRRPALKKKKQSTGKQETGRTSLLKKAVESKERFLTAYLEAEGNISLAAEEAGIDRSTHYGWMEKDREYAAKFKIYQETIEEREKQLFLAALAKNRNLSVSKAAALVGIDRGKHYEWLKDEKYAQQYQKVKEQIGDVLEEEAFRRAVEGTLEPVFHDGQVCGFTRRFSDGILTKMLAAYLPERYREKQAEINIRNNVNIKLSDALGAARERLRNVKGIDRDGIGISE